MSRVSVQREECFWTWTRSWAPSGLVRIQRAAELRTRHRAQELTFLFFVVGVLEAWTDGFRRYRLKIDQKSTKKMINKSTKHRPTINQNRQKIDQNTTWADGVPLFWSRAQVVLDLGALLGSSWRRPETVLEASWAVLGRERWPTWVQLGFQNAAKSDEKSVPKLINFMLPLGICIFQFLTFSRRQHRNSSSSSSRRFWFATVSSTFDDSVLADFSTSFGFNLFFKLMSRT